MADYPDFTYKGDIDIIAQTIGNLGVNIAAQTLAALGINITAQDLAELIIKIHAQDVGVYIERDWASTRDEDKSLTGRITFGTDEWLYVIDYTIPASKVLYLDDFAYYISTARIVQLLIGGVIVWQTDTIVDGREAFTFTTPKKAIATEAVQVRLYRPPEGSWSGNFDANLGCREYSV